MKNLKVSMKLIVSFVIVIVLTVIVGVVGIIGMQNIAASGNEMFYEQLEPIVYMAASQEYFQRVRIQTRNIAISTGNIAEIDSWYGDMRAREATFTENFELWRPFMRTPEGERMANDIEDAFYRVFMPGIEEIVVAAREGVETSVLMEMMEVTTEAADTISDHIDSILDLRIAQAHDLELANVAMSNMLLTVIIVVIVITIAVSLFLAFYISGLISKPVGVLTTFMQRAATTGDIDLRPEEEEAFGRYSKVKDEIGQAIGATSEFVHEINEEMDMLQKVGEGDLTITPNVLSANDKIGNALSKVVDSLNTMFGEINTATGQVSVGSKQIAEGAQSLAQGSTEQAASVEELSASIGEIAKKTKENADKAGRAATLAGTIMQNAEKGSRQMDEMTKAVHEISEASQSISKVIKVIDDIAFQTNILALNAAVEAARAGQHGKGFAVVAEEVRSLAAKSAEAAKDTGGLIQDSMEKAELGARIAGETADSLTDIVSGINESNQIVNEIAVSSEEQSTGITQINTGIDQVAQVVQQNSATAQQSAAASEQMSGQSTMLESLIAQFKLKNAGFGATASLPPRTAASPPPAPAAKDAAPATEFDNDGNDGFGKY